MEQFAASRAPQQSITKHFQAEVKTHLCRQRRISTDFGAKTYLFNTLAASSDKHVHRSGVRPSVPSVF